MTAASIDAHRLWAAHMEMAGIGATSEGGSNRQALSAEDAEARALLSRWCHALGLRFEQDAIGNMFFRRKGSNPAAAAIAFGSHLDTVPTGGRFDGVFGVLAGLEVMRALDAACIRTHAPLELVNWTNEEGSRFRPAMMGSRVHAGDMTLETALATTARRFRSAARRPAARCGAFTTTGHARHDRSRRARFGADRATLSERDVVCTES